MKSTILLLAGLLVVKLSSAQLKPADQGSVIKFTIDNFGFGVDGSFKGLQGSINFDPENAAAAQFDVTIDASTVNTDNSLRDSHLRNDSYFDVKNYPRIRLVSTKITPTGKAGTYQFTGQLTIKNVTKEVSFPFAVSQAADGLSFSGSFKIKRKDFAVGGSSTISNELTVSLNVLATK
jgi:polyisoprenoid-binding protein YceI